MHDGEVQQPEGVRPAPPAGGVGGVPAVAGPGIALILFQAVEPADVFGVADPLEDAHVFAAGKYVRALDFAVDADDAARHIFAFGQVRVGKFARQRRQKVAVDERFALDGGRLARLYFGSVHDLEVALDKRLRLFLRLLGVEKEVKGVKVLVVRVDAVARKAAAEAVGSVVHDGDGLDHAFARHLFAAAVDHAHHGAPRRVAELSFSLLHSAFSVR